MTKRRYRIAWFSPLPLDDERSGLSSAYATSLLMPILSESMDVDLYHNSFESYEQYPTYHYLKAAQRHSDQPYDFFLYHLEDHPTAQFSRVHSVLKPGIVWFHDYLFSGFGPEPILSSPWQKVASQFYMSVRNFPSRMAKAPQRGPQAFREAAFAHTALFSSACMIGEYMRLRTEVPSVMGNESSSYHVPLPVSMGHSQKGDGGKAIAFCGRPGLEERAHKVLSALSQLESHTLEWLLNSSEVVAAKELIREAGVESRVNLHTNRTPEHWTSLLESVQIAIHLRFSAFGHTGPYMPISLAAGKQVIVSEFGEMDHLPDEIVYKIRPGDTEAQELYYVLSALVVDAAVEARATQDEYARQLYHPEGVALQLRTALDREYVSYQSFLEQWHTYESDARHSLFDELKEFERDSEPVCSPYDMIVAPFLEHLAQQVS